MLHWHLGGWYHAVTGSWAGEGWIPGMRESPYWKTEGPMKIG